MTNRTLAWCTLLSSTVLLCPDVRADRYVVPPGTPGGTDTPPYTDWSMAATQIQWAVDEATAGETVWISNGVYVLSSQITVAESISIVGTGGTVVVDGNNATRCFYFNSGKSCLLADLTIRRGSVTGSGGGAYLSRESVVRDCIFTNNSASVEGGGMYFYDTGVLNMQGCTFVDNTAYDGGGMYFRSWNNSTDYIYTSIVETCVFRGNQATHSGGGMYGRNSGRSRGFIVSDCDFVSNNANNDGGGAYFYYTGVVRDNSLFSGNSANQGGGMYLYSGWLATNCYVSSNNAVAYGGGIFSEISPVKNCLIADNTVTQQGGGIYCKYNCQIEHCTIEDNACITGAGGGIQYTYGPVTIRNCLIRNNRAAYAGGIRFNGNDCRVESCTIVGNYADEYGGGIYNPMGATYTATVENCIIYLNDCGMPAYSNYYSTSVKSIYSHNCIAPPLTAGVTSNNLASDPEFVDRQSGDYRLKGLSPCVNTGTNRTWMTGAVDLDGSDRIYQFGVVDRGCYEFAPAGTLISIR